MYAAHFGNVRPRKTLLLPLKRICQTRAKSIIRHQKNIYDNSLPYGNTKYLRLFPEGDKPLCTDVRSLSSSPVQSNASDSPSDIVEAKIEEMHALAKKYTSNLPKHKPKCTANIFNGETVLLTGTTGAFGCNLLSQLLRIPEVTRIYAVNRAQKGGIPLKRKQVSAFKDRGLDPGLLESSKLFLVEADTSCPSLGIPADLFEEVRDSITLIIHNAWPVHFKRTLSSFEPVIAGVRHLIDLALASPQIQPPRLIFTSSIGVFRNYASMQIVPEAMMDASAAVGGGYIESKWVGECMLEVASQQTPLRPVSVRLGQISGGANGSWNIREWMPSMVRSGQVIGCFPARQEEVNWLPAHSAAAALIEARNTPAQYLTMVHPHPVRWDAVAKHLCQLLGAELVPYSEWLAALERSAEERGTGEAACDVARVNPAVRLLEFYKAAENASATLVPSRLSTAEATRASPTLASLKPLTHKDVERWMTYWRSVSFLE